MLCHSNLLIADCSRIYLNPFGSDLIKNHKEHACDRLRSLWKLEPGAGLAPVV